MSFKSFLLTTAIITFPFFVISNAVAQTQTVVDSSDVGGGVAEGITLDSNSDATAGEFFLIQDNNDAVFEATGGVLTSIQNDGNVTIDYDQDDSGAGTFSLQSGGADALTSDNAGSVTIYNLATTNGIDNGNDGITNAGAVSGVTTLGTSGLATLNSASVTNGLTVSGATTTNGIDNGNDGITNAGAVSGVTTLGTSGLATLNSADVQNNLDVDGTTTTDGITNDGNIGTTTLGTTGLATLNSAQVDNGLTVNGTGTFNNAVIIDSNGATVGGVQLDINNTSATTTSADGNSTQTVDNNGLTLSKVDGADTNSFTVGNTQTTTVNGANVSYGSSVNGGLLVDGDLGVTGTIFSSSAATPTGVKSGENGLDVDGATNSTSLIADSNALANDGRGVISLQEDQASFYVFNSSTGDPHGLAVTQSQTVLSGGTSSTSLTLNDAGATFSDSSTGAPAKVTGIADGTERYDAVNYGQLRKAYAGVASIAAMSNIPDPQAGRRFSLGLGVGGFESEYAAAVGATARIHDNLTLKASYGRSEESNSFGAGIGFGW